MKILVGKVLKAQGIKGELKLSCLLNNDELDSVKQLYVGDRLLEIASKRFSNGYLFVAFKEIIDRNGAEALQNWEVFAEKEDINLPKDTYFIQDLLGCVVVLNNGTRIGKVVDIAQLGSADVYTVMGESKRVSFPFLKDLVISVDISSKYITLDATRFDEVSVYED